MEKNNNALKWLGLGATLIGVAASLVSDYVGEKKTDALIGEKVAEAVAKIGEKESV